MNTEADTEDMPLQKETFKQCYGKPVPKTYDALYINGHYKDPRAVNARIKSIISASLVVAAVAVPVLLIH